MCCEVTCQRFFDYTQIFYFVKKRNSSMVRNNPKHESLLQLIYIHGVSQPRILCIYNNSKISISIVFLASLSKE